MEQDKLADPRLPSQEAADSAALLFLAEPNRIAFITKIVESMGHLAMVSTVDRRQGLLRAICAPSAVNEVERLLEELDCRFLGPNDFSGKK